MCISLYCVFFYERVGDQRERHVLTHSFPTRRSSDLFVDLNADELKPRGWGHLHKPEFTAPEDMALYELHVRDFSIDDVSVPASERGTFRAFTHRNRDRTSTRLNSSH